MISVSASLRTLVLSLAGDAARTRDVVDFWAGTADALAPDLKALAHEVDKELTAWANTATTLAPERQSGPEGSMLLSWCSAASRRADVRLVEILRSACASPDEGLATAARNIARQRVLEGPLIDALPCAPLLGSAANLQAPELAETIARLEILIWEAGAQALEVLALGPWIWGSEETFELLVAGPAHGTLMGRVLAARILEVSARGMPTTASPYLVGRTLQVLQPLLLHPEPLVWVHAARALGRMTQTVHELENTLLDWVLGDTKLLRQRAMTAFASLPRERLSFLASQLVRLLDSPTEADWALAAVAAATPYLFFERRELWDRLADRILGGDGGTVAARALARGLAVLLRRETVEPEILRRAKELRQLARLSRTEDADELRRWLEVMTLTDGLDRAERDPLDLETGIENLMRMAAEVDDHEADARAWRFASLLAPIATAALDLAVADGPVRHRAAAINALEGAARQIALRLWRPILETAVGEPMDEPDLSAALVFLKRTPDDLLEAVAEFRARGDSPLTTTMEVLAIRLAGYTLDATADPDERGSVAHDACLLLRRLEGLKDRTRALPPALETALSSLFWRLVDSTRGTALGEVDDIRWLGPFAAWWALVIDRPEVLLTLASALPLIAQGALDHCAAEAELLRTTLASGTRDGAWRVNVESSLLALHAQDTELARSLSLLADALEGFAAIAGFSADLDARALALVVGAFRVQAALANPVRALVEHDDAVSDPPEARRICALVSRAIKSRDLSIVDVWLASLGPMTARIVESAIGRAIERTPPPPQNKKKATAVIEGYELVKPLGEGGVGTVWLVRKPGADRLFVLKIPKADALASANEFERDGILKSFVEEARALAGLYHPNVANIIDWGIFDSSPFLVLEYLIGADLKQYATAKLMRLEELRQIVLDAGAGLAALHNAGLVHRDIKPANIWLRLPLGGGEGFDPAAHRDPSKVMPLSAVVIDFGMVRAVRIADDMGGRFVAGTAGYIAPEQVLDPVVLDPRADVYGLAATLYNVTSGRSFFDEIESPRDRLMAHIRRDPFEDRVRLKRFPAAVSKVLKAATAISPGDRPGPIEFARAFNAAVDAV